MGFSIDDIARLLEKVDLFSSIPDKGLKRLAGMTRDRTFMPGRQIAHEGEGEPLAAFHLIVEGTAAVSAHGHPLRTLGPGDYFGEISMIDGKPRSATVTANDEVTTLTIPHVVFEDLVTTQPEFAHALLKMLCARLREIEAKG